MYYGFKTEKQNKGLWQCCGLQNRSEVSMCCFCLITEISNRGDMYLEEQIENAVNGVKEMKNVMLKSSEDRQRLLDALEKTKKQKEVPNYTHTSVLMPQ